MIKKTVHALWLSQRFFFSHDLVTCEEEILQLKHILRSRTMLGGQHIKGEMNIHVLWVIYIAMICLIKSASYGNIMTKS